MPTEVPGALGLGAGAPGGQEPGGSSFGAGHDGPNKAAETMPERKEKTQLLRDGDSAQLSVKHPGQEEHQLRGLSVRTQPASHALWQPHACRLCAWVATGWGGHEAPVSPLHPHQPAQAGWPVLSPTPASI